MNVGGFRDFFQRKFGVFSLLMEARTIGNKFFVISTHPDFFVNGLADVCSLRLQSVMQVSNSLY